MTQLRMFIHELLEESHQSDQIPDREASGRDPGQECPEHQTDKILASHSAGRLPHWSVRGLSSCHNVLEIRLDDGGLAD